MSNTSNAILKHIEIQKKKVHQNLLPDTCKFYPVLGSSLTVSGPGIITTSAPVAREWVNPGGDTVTDIPCRMSYDRAAIPDKLPNQTVVVDRYILEVPIALRDVVEQTDRVEVNDRKYEIRRFSDQSAWDVTLEMTVVEISTEIDHP